MKTVQLTLLIQSLTLVFSNFAFSQCDDVTVPSLSNPGPYAIAVITEADGMRDGPDYDGATLFYPTNGTAPYPCIAMVPGFNATPNTIQNWGPYYASHGIITIIIGTNAPNDNVEQRAKALLDALETLRQEDTRAASPVMGQIDQSRFAVSGWSMGGGGAQRAAVLEPSIKAVVALCPWLENASLNHTSPVLISVANRMLSLHRTFMPMHITTQHLHLPLS